MPSHPLLPGPVLDAMGHSESKLSSVLDNSSLQGVLDIGKDHAHTQGHQHCQRRLGGGDWEDFLEVVTPELGEGGRPRGKTRTQYDLGTRAKSSGFTS